MDGVLEQPMKMDVRDEVTALARITERLSYCSIWEKPGCCHIRFQTSQSGGLEEGRRKSLGTPDRSFAEHMPGCQAGD